MSVSELPPFDSLWNYGDPLATEAKFRELLVQAELHANRDYHAQLLTQIARTYSLRAEFSGAHQLLDTVEAMIEAQPKQMKLAHVRYLLERGRTYNSAGETIYAAALFERAYHEAMALKEMNYAIDALHMIAIAEGDAEKQVQWNLKGIDLALSNPGASGWLNALYNNIGESYAALGEYTIAAEYFDKLIALQTAKGRAPDRYTIKDKARMLRLGGEPHASHAIIAPLFEGMIATNNDDGWIREELAEALHAIGKTDEAKQHFMKALELLENDEYCKQHETAKLARLKKMAE